MAPRSVRLPSRSSLAARSKQWCRVSLQIFTELARDGKTGVFVRPVNYYFKRPVQEDEFHRTKMEELKTEVGGFRHDPALIKEHGVNPELALQDAYTHLAPMVDTDAYMEWLTREVAPRAAASWSSRSPARCEIRQRL